MCLNVVYLVDFHNPQKLFVYVQCTNCTSETAGTLAGAACWSSLCHAARLSADTCHTCHTAQPHVSRVTRHLSTSARPHYTTRVPRHTWLCPGAVAHVSHSARAHHTCHTCPWCVLVSRPGLTVASVVKLQQLRPGQPPPPATSNIT